MFLCSSVVKKSFCFLISANDWSNLARNTRSAFCSLANRWAWFSALMEVQQWMLHSKPLPTILDFGQLLKTYVSTISPLRSIEGLFSIYFADCASLTFSLTIRFLLIFLTHLVVHWSILQFPSKQILNQGLPLVFQHQSFCACHPPEYWRERLAILPCQMEVLP